MDKLQENTPTKAAPVPILSIDDAISAANRRAKTVLGLLQTWTTLVEVGDHVEIRIEPISPGLETLSMGEVAAIRGCFKQVNRAIREGHFTVTPGCSTIRMKDRGKAVDALAPGLLGSTALNSLSAGGATGPLATVEGQWIPPGIAITLTPSETNDLIDVLLIGSVATLASIIETWGFTAEVALPLGIALAALALEVKICKELSATGAVGFKISQIPIPMIFPFPA